MPRLIKGGDVETPGVHKKLPANDDQDQPKISRRAIENSRPDSSQLQSRHQILQDQNLNFESDSESDDDPYKYSNREKGTLMIGIFEIILAVCLTIVVCLAWHDPSIYFPEQKFLKNPYWPFFLPQRYMFEIGFVHLRSILSATSGFVLIYAASRRSIPHCWFYLGLHLYLLTFHYTFLVAELIFNEPYPTFLSFPEVILRAFTIWTVVEFLGELRYYEKVRYEGPTILYNTIKN